MCANWHVAVPTPPRLATPQAEAELELGDEDDVRPGRLGELERLAPACRAAFVGKDCGNLRHGSAYETGA